MGFHSKWGQPWHFKFPSKGGYDNYPSPPTPIYVTQSLFRHWVVTINYLPYGSSVIFFWNASLPTVTEHSYWDRMSIALVSNNFLTVPFSGFNTVSINEALPWLPETIMETSELFGPWTVHDNWTEDPRFGRKVAKKLLITTSKKEKTII